MLGLYPRGRGPGEEFRPVSPLQADQHEHAVAADQQGEPPLSLLDVTSDNVMCHGQARSGTMNLGGSLTRQVEQDCSVSEASPHIANIGRLVEDMENKIRNTLNEIYFGKTRDIVNGLRSVVPLKDANTAKDLQVGTEMQLRFMTHRK